MMSREQLKQLGIAASAAVKHQRSIGALSAATLPPDLRGENISAQNEFWRHQQVGVATNRVCSFKELKNKNPDEYSLVMQHFESLAGPAWAGRAVKRTVRVIENRHGHTPEGAGMIREIWQLAKMHGLGPKYIEAVCRGKFKGETDLTLLSAGQLRQLIATLRHRGHGKAKSEAPRVESPKPQAKADEGVRAPSKSREYVLKKFVKPSDVDAGDIPF